MPVGGVKIQRITLTDDLPRIATSMRGSEWGADNEMDDYSVASLKSYLKQPGTLLVMAFSGDAPVGALLATTILNPYRKSNWLYIDEVDVKPDFRGQGIATAMLQEAFAFGREQGLHEAWLGTEPENPANYLYKSLNPKEIEPAVGYTFTL